jgi:hypothetical protein
MAAWTALLPGRTRTAGSRGCRCRNAVTRSSRHRGGASICAPVQSATAPEPGAAGDPFTRPRPRQPQKRKPKATRSRGVPRQRCRARPQAGRAGGCSPGPGAGKHHGHAFAFDSRQNPWKQKKPTLMRVGFFRRNVRRCPTLPRGLPRSTIGAEELNFRVRDGTGCFPLAIAAATLWKYRPGSRPYSGNRIVDANPRFLGVHAEL